MEEFLGRLICKIIFIKRMIPYAIVGGIVGYLVDGIKGMIIGAIVLAAVRYLLWRLLGKFYGWLIRLGNEK